jgi:phage-related protein (TIGR01555 family)
MIMPGVLPKGHGLAMDQDASVDDIWAFVGNRFDGEGLPFLGFAVLAELAQRPEFRRATEIIAEEMTRKWISLEAAGKDDKSKRIGELEEALEHYKVRDVFRRAAEMDGFFGRAQIYLDTGDTDRPDELVKPLMPQYRISKKRPLQKLIPIEPMWSYPANYNASNPLRSDYYQPQSWYVMGKEVHCSRLLTLISREMPDIMKPAYAFAGLSLTQMLKPYVDNFVKMRQSVADLVSSFAVSGIKTNMSAILAGSGGAELEARARLFNQVRNTRGLFLLDKEMEEFFTVSTPLTSLDSLLAQAQEQQAGIARSPLVKLLGITPSGLNASSDGEIKCFYDAIHAQQENFYREPLTYVIDCIQLSIWNEVDPDISFRFEPLWQLDEAAQAAVRKTNADTAVEYINAGVILPEEERQRVAEERESAYSGLDLSVDVAAQLAEHAMMQGGEEEDDTPKILPDPAKSAEPASVARSGV